MFIKIINIPVSGGCVVALNSGRLRENTAIRAAWYLDEEEGGINISLKYTIAYDTSRLSS